MNPSRTSEVYKSNDPTNKSETIRGLVNSVKVVTSVLRDTGYLSVERLTCSKSVTHGKANSDQAVS